MDKIRFALIGSGYRAQYYIRIAALVPDRFSLSAVLIRDAAKGKAFSEKHHVKTVQTLEELLAGKPDFVVVSVKRGAASGYLSRLFELGVPVLTETPPAETIDDLSLLWENAVKQRARIQVAEQYYLQPLYAAWYQALREGLIGEVQNITLSALHGYHGVSMIRRMLGVGKAPCTIHGKRYSFSVTKTDSREGMTFDGQIITCKRDRAVFEFEGGGTAFFDFSDPVQYHSFIRTRQLNIQGTRGEIDDLTIRYLAAGNIPVKEDLRRIDLGVYTSKEWSHYGMMLGERFLYRSPLEKARLNDDELAIASLLLGMADYVSGGAEVYSLADALQDTYLSLKLEEALLNPLQVIQTKPQIWDDAL